MAEENQAPDYAAEIESLKAQLKATTEKAERFAKHREETRIEYAAAQAAWKTEKVSWRLQRRGVDPELAEVLARTAPEDEKALEAFEAKWAEKFKAPEAPEAPPEPKPAEQPAPPKTIMVPPRPGIATPNQPSDPRARLMEGLAALTKR